MLLRWSNGIVALLLAVFFACHEVMGAPYCAGWITVEVPWIVWLAVGVIAVHITLSIGTTKQMLDDVDRPPSENKKRHQAKKWVTGIMAGLLIAAHVLAGSSTPAWTIIAILLDIAIVSHICMSAKSLVKDLRMPSSWRFAVRALAIAIAVAAGSLLLTVIYTLWL